MALPKCNLKCDECGKFFNGVRMMHRDPGASYRILCIECLEGADKVEKRKWLKERREGKTLEQRVTWLEEWVYYTIEGFNMFNAEVEDIEKK